MRRFGKRRNKGKEMNTILTAREEGETFPEIASTSLFLLADALKTIQIKSIQF